MRQCRHWMESSRTSERTDIKHKYKGSMNPAWQEELSLGPAAQRRMALLRMQTVSQKARFHGRIRSPYQHWAALPGYGYIEPLA